MGFLPETLAVLAEGGVVYAARTVELDFEEGVERLWEGFGFLVLEGQLYKGGGQVGTFGDIPFAEDDAAEGVVLSLSGVAPPLVAQARSASPVRGRSATIGLQFFDQNHQPLDELIVLAEMFMDVMTYSGVGPASRTISLSLESEWVDRNTAEYGTYTPADQAARGYPDDRFFDFVNEITIGVREDWQSFDH